MTEELDDQLAEDVGLLMFTLTQKYGSDTRRLAVALARSLGMFIALAAKHPKDALDEAAALIRNTPWPKLRQMQFGLTLGAGDSKIITPDDAKMVRAGLKIVREGQDPRKPT